MSLLLVGYVALVFFMSTRPGLHAPGPGFHMADKVAHFVEYAVMGTLIAAAFGHAVGSSRLGAFMFLLAVGATLGAIDETLQSHTPEREMSVFDWMADVAGVAVSVGLMMRWRLNRPASDDLHTGGESV